MLPINPTIPPGKQTLVSGPASTMRSQVEKEVGVWENKVFASGNQQAKIIIP
jgi:hypothetical protein